MDKKKILKKVDILYLMWKQGKLGGEVMPEDANPGLEKKSLENYLYFTLPMALNYQRNSYTLWENALKTYNDEQTRFVFNPQLCLEKNFEEVRFALTKYKVALQSQKQTEIWLKLCSTFVELFKGDIRILFEENDNDVKKIRDFIQVKNKKKFPYLSGNKLCNYWLYVIYQYTDRNYTNIKNLTVAPDTHVIKSTHKLGLISDKEFTSPDVQLIVIDKWNKLFKGTKYKPIDIHTSLWLWSRNGFIDLDESVLNSNDMKNKIKDSYEQNNYLEKFRRRDLLPFEKMIFDKVIDLIPKNGNVLDLGCGNGYPYDYYFCSKGFNLLGVDFCEKHIDEAKKINVSGSYFVGDIETYKIDKKYDLIMMLFSLLHLPREQHGEILQNIYNHLNDKGVFILTLRDEDAGIIKYKDNFCNREMMWSYYDYKTYIDILSKIGFKVIFSDNQNKYGIEESHNWVILQK